MSEIPPDVSRENFRIEGSLQLEGTLLPSETDLYDLGSDERRFRDLWLAFPTEEHEPVIHIGDQTFTGTDVLNARDVTRVAMSALQPYDHVFKTGGVDWFKHVDPLGTPTTVYGYHITDAYVMDEINHFFANTSTIPMTGYNKTNWDEVYENMQGDESEVNKLRVMESISINPDTPSETITIKNGYIQGPDTLYIDPAGHNLVSGKVVILGDLQVDGDTTTVNSATLSITDKKIQLAKDATTASQANGAGLNVVGADANITYTSAVNQWVLDRGVDVDGASVFRNGDVKIKSDGSVINGATLVLTHSNNNTDDIISTIAFENNVTQAARLQVNTVGGNNNGQISFYVSEAGVSKHAMTIDSEQRVGIGTVNPLAKFEVSDGSSSIKLHEYNNGAAIFLDGSDGDFVGSDYFHIIANGSSYLGLGGVAGGTTPLNIDSTGKVGIGTTTPTDELQIKGSNAPYINVEASDVSDSGVSFARQGVKKWYILNDPDIADNFAIRGDGGTPDEFLTITQTGKVGIGKAAPAYKLDVAGGAKFDGEAITNTTTSEGIYIGKSQSDQSRHVSIVAPDDSFSYIDFATTESDYAGRIIYSHLNERMSLFASASEKMRIDNTRVSVINSKLNVNVDAALDGLVNIHTGSNANVKALMFTETTASAGMGVRTHFDLSGAENAISIFSQGYGDGTGTSFDGDHVTFTVDGRVGIGTVTPQSKLQVVYSEAESSSGELFQDVIRVRGDWINHGSGPAITFTNYHASANDQNPSTDEYNVAAIQACDFTGQWSGGLKFFVAPDYDEGGQTGGTSLVHAMSIRPSGNVGIGTTNPARLLHLKNSNSSIVFETPIDANGSAYAQIKSGRDGSSGYSSTLEFATTESTTAVGTFGSNGTGGSGFVTRMLIDSAGNVGIGTNNPTHTLHVYGSARIERNGQSPLLQFTDQGSSNRWIGIPDGSQKFSIYANDGTTEQLTIDKDGNVGINKTAPSAELDVEGDIQCNNIIIKGNVAIEGVVSDRSYTNNTSTTIDTTYTAAEFEILEVFGSVNPNSLGSGSYSDPVHMFIYNGTGWNGTSVRNYVYVVQIAPLARSQFPSAFVGNGNDLDVCWVDSNGVESDDCPPDSTTHKLRIKQVEPRTNTPPKWSINITKKL